MNIILRKATLSDYDDSWSAIAYGKKTMFDNGRHQWTDDYPSPALIHRDIEVGQGYVLTVDGKVAAYGVIVLNGEPEYKNLKDGEWLTNEDYYVVHRMAVAASFRGKGMGKAFFLSLAEHCKVTNIHSIKVDTNHDNVEMLHLLPSIGFKRCGIIDYADHGTRIAFELVV